MERGDLSAFAHDAAQGGHELGSGGAQFLVVVKSELTENFLAFRGQREQDFAAIALGTSAVNETSGFEAVHQLHRAVVADLHAVGQFADPWPNSGREALDGQHQLILAALEPRLLDHLLAEVEKAANTVAELRQRLVVRQGQFFHAGDCVVLRSPARG